MNSHLLLVLLFGAFSTVKCKGNLFSSGDFNYTPGDEPEADIPHSRHERALKSYLPAILSCAVKYDTLCLVNNAEIYLEDKRVEVLAEADAAAVQMRGSSDGDSPSQLASIIGNVISEMTSLFKDSFAGFFRDSKDTDEDDDGDEDDADVEEETSIEENKKSRHTLEEDRGKKKKQKLKALIKLILLGVVLYAKSILLLKFLAWKVQVKFLLIALGNLLINALKLWWEFKAKNAHNPQKVIYYEHAQHQHHYDGGGEDWESSGPPSGSGGYWGRSYENKQQQQAAAQELAYAKQRPQTVVDYAGGINRNPASSSSSSSWFSK